MKKVIVAGSRQFSDYKYLKTQLNTLFNEPVIIVSGRANGADKLGEQFAAEKGFAVELHPANWEDFSEPCEKKINRYGKEYNVLAGYKRNEDMLQSVLSNPDGGMLVAFWDGKSKGTKQMIDIANKADIPVVIFGVKV